MHTESLNKKIFIRRYVGVSVYRQIYVLLMFCEHPHTCLHCSVYIWAGGQLKTSSSPLICGSLHPLWRGETSSPLPRLCLQPGKPPYRTSDHRATSYLQVRQKSLGSGFFLMACCRLRGNRGQYIESCTVVIRKTRGGGEIHWECRYITKILFIGPFH